jgi:hypothetical protein
MQLRLVATALRLGGNDRFPDWCHGRCSHEAFVPVESSAAYFTLDEGTYVMTVDLFAFALLGGNTTLDPHIGSS